METRNPRCLVAALALAGLAAGGVAGTAGAIGGPPAGVPGGAPDTGGVRPTVPGPPELTMFALIDRLWRAADRAVLAVVSRGVR